MHRDVHTYVNSCTTCQQNKASIEAAAGLARPLPVPDKLHDVWGLDFIIMPPNKDGKNCVAVFVCHKSKKVHAVAATMTGDETNPLSAEQVARIYFDTIFKHFGLCSALVSDRDVRFVSASGVPLIKKISSYHSACDFINTVVSNFEPFNENQNA
jgi:hypothetical protein